MGYELEMHVGEISDGLGKVTGGGKYFMNVATIDLCKCGNSPIGQLVAKAKKKTCKLPKVYWYGSNGDTRITEDRYNDALRALDPKRVLAAIRKGFEESKQEYSDGYRRYAMAIALLESTIPRFGKNLKVAFFGH